MLAEGNGIELQYCNMARSPAVTHPPLLNEMPPQRRRRHLKLLPLPERYEEKLGGKMACDSLGPGAEALALQSATVMLPSTPSPSFWYHDPFLPAVGLAWLTVAACAASSVLELAPAQCRMSLLQQETSSRRTACAYAIFLHALINARFCPIFRGTATPVVVQPDEETD